MGRSASVRNKEGLFVNTQLLRTEALHFNKYGYYCPDPKGSYGYKDYWEEQLRRCIEGYSVGGVKITGDHYYYLNFSQIKLTPTADFVGSAKTSKGKKKVRAFPSFYDGDYDYFHCLEIAKNGCTEKQLAELHLTNKPKTLTGGLHMCVLKARRKGFSYKNGAIAANRYNSARESVTVIGASDAKFLYPEGTMGMVNEYISFATKHTAWGKKREYVDKVSHKKASFKEFTSNGIGVEQGYKSQVLAVTFKDNPDAARGKDGTLVLFEEAGKFKGLKDAIKATLPAMSDGIYTTGQIIVFGTGKGGEDGYSDWEDFEEIYYNPTEYNMLSFEDIWSPDSEKADGCYFFPNQMNFPGFMDKDGNSKKQEAVDYELAERQKLLDASTKGAVALDGRLQEYAMTPQEAMLQSGNNNFPIMEIKKQLSRLKAKPELRRKAKPVHLGRDKDGKAIYNMDTGNTLVPLFDWKPKTADISGCAVMFEEPVIAPKGTYKIGYDPYNQNKAASSASYGAAYVYKGANSLSFTSDTIVASLVGRPNSPEVYHRNLLLLAEIYNAEIMHENEAPEVRSWFRRRKKLGYLAVQPDEVINVMVKNSKVARNFGCHMTKEIKSQALGYLREWLIKETVTNTEDEKMNVFRIYDMGLLTELANYNFKKDVKGEANYDRISAMLQLMIFLEQEEIGHVYGKEGTKKDEKIKVINNIINLQRSGSYLGSKF